MHGGCCEKKLRGGVGWGYAGEGIEDKIRGGVAKKNWGGGGMSERV